MITSVGLALEKYKEELKEFAAWYHQAKARNNNVDSLGWGREDYEMVMIGRHRLNGMVTLLQLTPDEEKAIDIECGLIKPDKVGSTAIDKFVALSTDVAESYAPGEAFRTAPLVDPKKS